ncbi:hypothetical protein A5868_001466 [Enterococcus sp. 12F9_DIV0723]|uniref:hypothetical protein n=1 Tax=Enterococcus sp. 12F9_DIV0723 TaxID=1834169 RepID=UPI000B3E8E47|nr:hypothetical protein [Enterococcus sp. 12F9_DIV0723]OUZ16545.1 hypothetical protein A5868_001466 [Enterococcus sp. 12F9_DIV0723]
MFTTEEDYKNLKSILHASSYRDLSQLQISMLDHLSVFHCDWVRAFKNGLSFTKEPPLLPNQPIEYTRLNSAFYHKYDALKAKYDN